jgi:hypothetical protein
METTSPRSFKRVDDYLPYTYRLIFKEEYDLLEKKYLSGTVWGMGITPAPWSWSDQTNQVEVEHLNAETLAGLFKYLYMIDLKLNTILDALAGKKDESLFFRAPAKINISGSGVRFLIEEKVNQGDYLEIRIALPGWPLCVIPALGEVVHVVPSPEPNRHEIAVHFTAISEQAREDLTRYIIKMERALLRSQSERGTRFVQQDKKSR